MTISNINKFYKYYYYFIRDKKSDSEVWVVILCLAFWAAASFLSSFKSHPSSLTLNCAMWCLCHRLYTLESHGIYKELPDKQQRLHTGDFRGFYMLLVRPRVSFQCHWLEGETFSVYIIKFREAVFTFVNIVITHNVVSTSQFYFLKIVLCLWMSGNIASCANDNLYIS